MGSDGIFRAERVLARHDENYMAPEVADALKAVGYEEHLGDRVY
jgi:cytochrome c-type biogenesis protein CcmE